MLELFLLRGSSSTGGIIAVSVGGVILLIIVILAIRGGKKYNKLKEEGMLIDRSSRFAEEGEEFTSRIGSFQALKEEIVAMDKPQGLKISGNASSRVRFESLNYTAQLYVVDYDEESGIGMFNFEFTHWKTGEYGYLESANMNILMTSIEKVFLHLDPNTGVKPYKVDFKIKHSFF